METDRQTDTHTHTDRHTDQVLCNASGGLTVTAYLAYYANVRVWKLTTPRVVASCARAEVLSVLASIRASGIIRYSFGQG